MDRPKKVNAALLFLHGFHDDISYEGWLKIVEDYIKGLELMVDSAYKTLEELDELV